MSRSRAGDRPAVRIEPDNEWAWCGDRRLDLTPKAFAVLRHFVEHAERLVTKEDLFSAVWPGTVVSEAALTSCIRDLRRALADSSQTPRYIETVHRRGFRFIGPVAAPPIATAAIERSATLVGRDAELARLRARFETAKTGRRQLVFVTGEAGIGKTTLVEAFLAELAAGDALRIGRGQCVEQYGAGEAYLPVLEALARMARATGGEALVQVLRRYAPTWLVQLPGLLDDEELQVVQRRAQGTTHDRMLRELTDALDAASLDVPLVLVLEDIHWSDSGTVDLLAMLARRRDPARMLILATYRPADVAAAGHALKPVKQELTLHGRCDEVLLDFLDQPAVERYLAERFPAAAFGPDFARFLHGNTGGNPLFLVNVIEHLVARGSLREAGGCWALTVPIDHLASDVPDTLAQLVDRQIERLTPTEQAVLGIGSVAGADFSTALATVDGIDPADAEACCAALARRGQFVRAAGAAEWPDGTIAARHAFIHALYRNALYGRIAIGHRVGLHLRIGALLERAYGERAGEIAGELAMHFEEGRDFERAVRYRLHAADNALRHYGHRESVAHARRALDLVAAFPESPERDRTELTIQTTLGAALIPMGSARPEVARTFARARELCARVGATRELLPTLIALFRFYASRGEMPIAREVADQLRALAATTTEATVVLGANNAAGLASFYAGEFATALEQLERGLDVYDRHEHSAGRAPAYWGGHDAGVSCGVHSAWALWALGYPSRATARMTDALAWARTTAYPFSLVNASHFAATFAACRHDVDGVRALVDSAVLDPGDRGFDLIAALGTLHRAWLDGDAEALRSGIATFRQQGGGIGLPTFLGLLAEAYGEQGRVDESLAALTEAVATADGSGMHYWDAELERLRGTILLRRGGTSAEEEAAACFDRAIEIAQRQQNRVLELRAATSLAGLRRRQGRTREARDVLAPKYAWFTEGFETWDLAQAKAELHRR